MSVRVQGDGGHGGLASRVRGTDPTCGEKDTEQDTGEEY